MTKVKEVSKGFSGQLSGDKKKEEWLSSFRKEMNIPLPKAGESKEYPISADKLDGAFLSCLDGKGSLTIDGKKVSKMSVYSGEIGLPKKFELNFIIVKSENDSTRLKASITSKK